MSVNPPNFFDLIKSVNCSCDKGPTEDKHENLLQSFCACKFLKKKLADEKQASEKETLEKTNT